MNAVQALAASPLFMASSGGMQAPEAAEVMRCFPPRLAEHSWPETRQSREQVLAWLLAPPFPLANRARQRQRRWGVMRVLDWLGSLPGSTWQERWTVSGAEDTGQWRQHGWAGEAEGLEISLAAANAKLAQLDRLNSRRNTPISLGIPTFGDIAGRAPRADRASPDETP